MVFFVCSDWLLILGIVSAVHLATFLWISREVFLISQKKGTIWCWLSTGLVYTKTVIHLIVGEEW